MLSKQPFERRILIAFVLMTVMVSGLFSLSIVGVVHFIEEHLVSQEMSRELGETLNEDIRQGRPPRLDSSTQFFSSYHDQYLIPQQYAGLQEGFNEVVSGDEAQANRVANAIEAGHVWINSPQAIFVQTSWGGFKASGIGRELGPWGMSSYLEVKHVTSRLKR